MANKSLVPENIDIKELLTPIQNRIIQLLGKDGPLPRKDIVKSLKIPRSTIYDNLLKLQKRKVLKKFTKNNGKRGRPFVLWALMEV